MRTGPLRAALFSLLALLLFPTAGFGYAEEVHRYDSLAELTIAADVVVLGRIVSTEFADGHESCDYTRGTLRVRVVLSGRLTLGPFAEPRVDFPDWCGQSEMPQIGRGIPAEQAVYFLTKRKPGPGEGDLTGVYRATIGAGTVVNRDGLAHLPLKSPNAQYLSRWEGKSFAELARAVPRAALPDSATARAHPSALDGPPALLGATAVAAVAAAMLFTRRRRRDAPLVAGTEHESEGGTCASLP